MLATQPAPWLASLSFDQAICLYSFDTVKLRYRLGPRYVSHYIYMPDYIGAGELRREIIEVRHKLVLNAQLWLLEHDLYGCTTCTVSSFSDTLVQVAVQVHHACAAAVDLTTLLEWIPTLNTPTLNVRPTDA
jgi:hypothetical protein